MSLARGDRLDTDRRVHVPARREETDSQEACNGRGDKDLQIAAGLDCS
ncbi:hypothetical protein [Methanothrix soehngenii]